MRKAAVLIFLSMTVWCGQAISASEPIKLELTVAPELANYTDVLFPSPAYAALALQNSGLALSLSKPMTLISRQSFQIGPGKISYIDRKGQVFKYQATMALIFGKEISVPIEIDAGDMASGRLHIRAYPALAGLIPQELIVRIESKLQILSNANAQKQLVSYLSERFHGKVTDPEAISRLYDTIVFDAYNQAGRGGAVGGGKDTGASESLSSQWALIISILIWLAGFPVFVYIIRRQRMRRLEIAQ
ncbi:MAG: hypothetical protein CK604_05275 [Curvibacter sp. PD_MW3]|nr:MAG: hypothetical protein CK604_05275 [Curvibacter sp. PD_MW3]